MNMGTILYRIHGRTVREKGFVAEHQESLHAPSLADHTTEPCWPGAYRLPRDAPRCDHPTTKTPEDRGPPHQAVGFPSSADEEQQHAYLSPRTDSLSQQAKHTLAQQYAEGARAYQESQRT